MKAKGRWEGEQREIGSGARCAYVPGSGDELLYFSPTALGSVSISGRWRDTKTRSAGSIRSNHIPLQRALSTDCMKTNLEKKISQTHTGSWPGAWHWRYPAYDTDRQADTVIHIQREIVLIQTFSSPTLANMKTLDMLKKKFKTQHKHLVLWFVLDRSPRCGRMYHHQAEPSLYELVISPKEHPSPDSHQTNKQTHRKKRPLFASFFPSGTPLPIKKTTQCLKVPEAS